MKYKVEEFHPVDGYFALITDSPPNQLLAKVYSKESADRLVRALETLDRAPPETQEEEAMGQLMSLVLWMAQHHQVRTIFDQSTIEMIPQNKQDLYQYLMITASDPIQPGTYYQHMLRRYILGLQDLGFSDSVENWRKAIPISR